MPKEFSIEEATSPAAKAGGEFSIDEAMGKPPAPAAPKKGLIDQVLDMNPLARIAVDANKGPLKAWAGAMGERQKEAGEEFKASSQLYSTPGEASDPLSSAEGLYGIAGSGWKALMSPVSGFLQAGPGAAVEKLTKGRYTAKETGDLSDFMFGLAPVSPHGPPHPEIPEDLTYKPYPSPKAKKAAAAQERPAEAPQPAEAVTSAHEPQPAPTAAPEGPASPAAPRKARAPRKPVTFGIEEATGAKPLEEPSTSTPERGAAFRNERGVPPEEFASQVPEELGASQWHKQSGTIPFEARDVGRDAEGKPLDVEPLEKGVFDLARDLNRALGIGQTHRQGRIGKSNALGIFNRKTGITRTRMMHEMQVMTHEYGHSFEFQNRPHILKVLAAHGPELEAFAHKHYPVEPPKGAERQEGFAEFFRLYVEHPELAQHDAPNFYKDFEDTLKQHEPDLYEKLQGVQHGYRAIIQAPSAVVAMSEVTSAERPGAIHNLIESAKDNGVMAFAKGWANEVYWGMFDRFNPINVATKALLNKSAEKGKPINLETYEHPYRMFRMTPGARNAAHMDILYGVHPYHTVEPAGQALADGISYALATAKDIAKSTAEGKNHLPVGDWSAARYHQFSTYLNARNMMAQWRRYMAKDREFPPSRHPPVVYEQAIKTFEEANPHWREAARMVYDWNENLWRLRYEAGLIDQQQYEMGLLQHPDYVPAFRDMRDPGDEIGGSTAGISNAIRGADTNKHSGGVKQMKGSTRDVVDPIWSMAQQAYELRMLVARNDAIGALVKLASKVEGGGAILEKVKSKSIQKTEISLAEALESARKSIRGLSERDEIELDQSVEMIHDILGENAKGTIYRATDASEAGDPIIYHWANGKRNMYQLPQGRLGQMMVHSIANMNRPSKDMWVNILSQPARVLRTMITLSPKFLVSNVLRDQPAAAAMNKGYIPFVDWGRGIYHEVRGALGKDDTSRRYNAAMGAIGGMQSAAERLVNSRKSIKAMINRGFDIREVPEKAAAITELSETGTRLGTFMRVEEQAKKKGLFDYEAAMHGSWESRDILDFDSHGAWRLAQDFSRMVPFANANLQGSSKIAKTLFSEQLFKYLSGQAPRTPQEAEAMQKTAWAWMVVGGLALASSLQRSYYADDPRFQEVNQTLRATHWVFLDPDHPERYYAYPKPYEMAAPSALAERAYEGVVLHDPKAMEHGWEDFFNLALPNISSPPILETPFALAGNRDYFKMPIVPEDQKNLSPKFQESEYTSELAKFMPLVGGSPAKTDYVMKQFGYIPQDLLRGSDEIIHHMQGKPDVEHGPQDAYTIGRWVRDLTRGSESSKAFWEMVGKNQQHTDDLHTLIFKRDEPKEAFKELEKMTTAERGWAMVNTFGRQPEQDVQPMNYVRNQFLQNSRMYRDISSQDIVDRHGKIVPLDAHQRHEAIDALRYLSLTQLHNALKTAHEPGFDHQKFMDPEEPMQRLRAVNPALAQVLNDRYATGHVTMSPQAAQRAWDSVRARYETLPSKENFLHMAKAKVESGSGAAARALRKDPAEE